MDIDLYEKAYLCGGPDRVARTALLSLHATGSIRVAESPPHKVKLAQRTTGYPVELVLLASLPNSGQPVRLVLRSLADSSEVDRCAAALLEEKLLRRSFRRMVRPTRAGMELRERLVVNARDEELGRFAVLGIPPEAVQPVLEALPPEREFPIKLAKRRARPGYDDRGDYNPPMGYARSGGAW